MDYISLINLVLVTVIYSTFVAPGLGKLSAIRDSIPEIRFPKLPKSNSPGTPGTQDQINEAADQLSSALNSYALKYQELQRFLKYFQWIIVGLIYIQLATMWIDSFRDKPISSSSIVSLLTVSLIILLVNRAIAAYMVRPSTVRSIKWLANNAAIKPVYYRELAGASLNVKAELKDVPASVYDVHIDLHLKILFTGYRYMLIVEKDGGEKLYYFSGGAIERTAAGASHYPDGTSIRFLPLGQLDLRPGTYKIRLIIFESPFMNKNLPVTEKVFTYQLKAEVQPQYVNEEVSLKNRSSKYITFEGQGTKIKRILCSELGSSEENVIRLLGIDSFNRLLRSTKGIFELKNINGHIDKPEIIHATSRRNILFRKLKKLFTRSPILKLN